MNKREKIQLDRARLFSALATLRAALIRGDTTAALRALDSVYRLLPIAECDEQTRRLVRR